MTTMPFGRHQGQSIEELPDDYLEWLHSIELQADWLREAVRLERMRRSEQRHWQKQRQQQAYSNTKEKTGPPARLDVARWYRQLSIRFHPDHGGSAEAMKVVHAAKDLLEQMIDTTG